MASDALAELTPTGTLRAGINLSNPLLVTGRSASGEPTGVAPDMARAVAERLGAKLTLVPFLRPGELADAVEAGIWDIGLIGAEPARAEKIVFTAAYTEIEATYLVPPGSALATMADVDQPGVRIAVNARSAYDLWLSRHIVHAKLCRAETIDGSRDLFVARKLEALAGLRPRLLQDLATLPGSRILPGQFATVQQAIGTARANGAAAGFLRAFVEEAKATGLVARLIERHGVSGLSVASSQQ